MITGLGEGKSERVRDEREVAEKAARMRMGSVFVSTADSVVAEAGA
jgi:hypothetical protein